MGVIAVQAGVGMHVIDTDPAEAKKCAREHLARRAAARSRRSAACSVCCATTTATPRYAPAPGLGDLDRLGRARCATPGSTVDVRYEGSRTELAAGRRLHRRTASCRRR